ncbi:MAG: NADH:ubiquinone reductase (Na(+)-transporting) subunit B [Crocinitomicaceae bacterium]|nr:NADH:ubiquinone reductase (Na(+)-transporting) subunit B [Crocinitomicaceae bacterium]
MKFLENIVNKMEPKFSKGGKLEKWHPMFESFMTLVFTPKYTTKLGSHIRDGVDLKRTMIMVIFAMVPALLFGIYNTGHWEMVAAEGNLNLPYGEMFWDKVIAGAAVVVPLIIVSYGVGLGIEFIFAMRRGHSLHEGFLVSGMLIPLIMPADVPLWMVGVATAFAVIIGKEIFGGTGMNILNVALTARAFLFFAYPTSMSGDKVWMSGLTENLDKVNAEKLAHTAEVAAGKAEKLGENEFASPLADSLDGFSGATPLGDLASFMTPDPVLNGSPLEVGSNLMDQFIAANPINDMFMGFSPGSIGETSTLAILIGAAILLITGVGSLRIMASFFAGGLLMGVILNASGGPYLDLPPLYHIVIGGFAFGAVFMATDPVTAAQTATGKIIYGLLGGMMAILIRVLNPAFPEGVMLAILFMNVMAPIIDHYVIAANIKKRLKRVKNA